MTEDDVYKYIKESNFKLARKVVAALASKQPKATFYKVLAQYVEYKASPKYNPAELYALVKGTPNDTKSLSLLHDFFYELGDTAASFSVFEMAALKYPSFDVIYEWWQASVKRHHFKMMYRASSLLPKYAANSRDIEFWNCLSLVLVLKFQRHSLSEQEIDLLPQIVLKRVPERTNDQERYVYCALLDVLDRSEDIVAELGSLQGKLDLYLQQFLLRHREKLGQWEELNSLCDRILVELDDFSVLQTKIRSCKQLGVDVVPFLKTRDSRNYRLSLLEYEVCEENIKNYLEKFHDKTCCYVDLMRYELPANFLSLFDEFEPGHVHDTNKMKFQMALGTVSDEDLVGLYTKYAGTMATKSKTDYSPCAEPLLVLCRRLCGSLDGTITAISLMESYLQHDPHEFNVKTLLCALYVHLGVPQLANKHSVELAIKKVQIDTFQHFVYSHIGSLLPNKAQQWINDIPGFTGDVYKCLDDGDRFINIAFQRNAWNKICGMFEFYHKLENSVNRWAMIAERLKLARLVGDKTINKLNTRYLELQRANNDANVWYNSREWSDNRDLKIIQLDSVLDVFKYDIDFEIAKANLLIKKQVVDMKEYTADAVSVECYKILHKFYSTKELEMGSEFTKVSNTNDWRGIHEYCTKLETLKVLSKDTKTGEYAAELKSQLVPLYEEYIDNVSKCQPGEWLERLGLVGNGAVERIIQALGDNKKQIKGL